jgi:hypothetical protein
VKREPGPEKIHSPRQLFLRPETLFHSFSTVEEAGRIEVSENLPPFSQRYYYY